MRAIITVISQDAVGIIASVSAILAKNHVNILDISQTTLQDIFAMMMLVDLSLSAVPFTALKGELEQLGQSRNLSVRIQREDIFNAMHQV